MFFAAENAPQKGGSDNFGKHMRIFIILSVIDRRFKFFDKLIHICYYLNIVGSAFIP